MVKRPQDIDALPPEQVKQLTIGLLEEVARLSAEVAALREENARLKGLKGKPDIKPSTPTKPSGMEKETERPNRKQRRAKKRNKAANPLAVHEDRIVKASDVP